MGNDLVERLKRLAAQHADGDPNYHGKRLLKAEDTMYWAAAARIEALEGALKEVTECFSEDYSIAHPRSQAALKLASQITKPR